MSYTELFLYIGISGFMIFLMWFLSTFFGFYIPPKINRDMGKIYVMGSPKIAGVAVLVENVKGKVMVNKSFIIGEKGIKFNSWYRLDEDGEFVEA